MIGLPGQDEAITQPALLAAVLGFALAGAGVWWALDRKYRLRREMLLAATRLGEEVLSAASRQEVLRKLESCVGLFALARARVFLHERAAGTLQCAEGAVFALQSPEGLRQRAAATCFQNRTALEIPDTRRSPFGQRPPAEIAKALLFVPMMAQTDVVGVLELAAAEGHHFRAEEKLLAQHLANLTAAAVQALDHRAIREQLFRSEKLAAVGRLVAEMPPGSEVPAAGIDGGQTEVDVYALVRRLVESCEHDWRDSGMRVRDSVPRDSALLHASESQLEQVFQTLLLDARQHALMSAERRITVHGSQVGQKALIEIAFSVPPEAMPEEPMPETEGSASGRSFAICRSILLAHGGDFRQAWSQRGQARFEVELPVDLVRSRAAGTLTVLLIEPDGEERRRIVPLLADHGCRVVPALSGEEALELSRRLHFDLALSSDRLSGLNWIELLRRLRGHVGACALVCDSEPADTPQAPLCLERPVTARNLEGLLATIEAGQPAGVES